MFPGTEIGVFATKQVNFGEFGGKNEESHPKMHNFSLKVSDNPNNEKR